MASKFDMAECVVVFKESSHPCILDTGSSLNLISWSCVCKFQLAHTMLPTKMKFKVADGELARAKGEVRDVAISMGDCNMSLTFEIVDYFCHDLLLGTSFIHESRSNLLFDKPTPMLRVNDGRVACEIPFTYHRSLPSAKQLEPDRANWPKDEALNQGEQAAEASCATMMPHFSTVLAAKAVLSTKASGEAAPCTVATNSVELDIEDMVADHSGLGPVPGLFPVRAETEVELPVVFTIEEAMIAEQQDKASWQLLPAHFARINA